MRKAIVLVTVFLMVLLGFGQSSEIDSLNQVLKKTQVDSSKVLTLVALSGNYARTNPDKAKELALEAIDLAQAAGFKPGLAQAYKAAGMSYYYQNNWIDALIQWELALEVYDSIDDLSGVSNMLNNLGAVNFNGGDDEQALKYYLQSLKVAEKANDSLRTVTALINIGTVYLNKPSTHDLAYKYYQRAYPLSVKLGNPDAIGTCAVNMGEIFLGKPDTEMALDSALFYFETALETYQESATGNVAFALKNIGTVYALRGEFEKAIQYQKDAFNFAKAGDGRLEMAQSLLALAKTYQLKGDLEKSISAYQDSYDLAKDIGSLYEVEAAFEGLAESYSGVKNYERAYQFQTLAKNYKDTLYNSEIDKKLQAQTLAYEIEKKQGEISLLQKEQELKEAELDREKTFRNGTVALGVLLLLLVGGLYNRYRYTHRRNKIIEKEKERSDELLLNILPHETAEELKKNGKATPKYYENVSVLFTDFQGFTKIAEQLTPQDLVEELNECFSAFDMIITKYKLEKIKTIGDSYMCASGIPTNQPNNALEMVKAALEVRDYMAAHRIERINAGHKSWELRIGIHSGPVVSGVVGKNKFAYDIWGDTVNTASRMETSGVAGEVNISGATYEQVKDYFVCKHRGKVKAKNKGEVDMYLVEGYKPVKEQMEDQVNSQT